MKIRVTVRKGPEKVIRIRPTRLIMVEVEAEEAEILAEKRVLEAHRRTMPYGLLTLAADGAKQTK